MKTDFKFGCVILAGGKSTRMGKDKALLEISGKSFIKMLSEEFDFFEEKMIARGNNECIQEISWTVVKDMYQERGPIGGLYSALKICKSEALFCISCDTPLAQKALYDILYEAFFEDEYDAVICMTKDKRVHPLCGIYRKSTVGIFEQQILSGNNRMMNAMKRMHVKYVELNSLTENEQLINVNTKEEFDALKKKKEDV